MLSRLRPYLAGQFHYRVYLVLLGDHQELQRRAEQLVVQLRQAL